MPANSTQYLKYAGIGATKPGFWLRDWFFNPDLIHDCATDAIVLGLLTDPSKNVDPWVDGDVHDYLYKSPNEQFGADLGAANIQRHRDHGTAFYYTYLDFCFGYKVTSWQDMAKFIPHEQLDVNEEGVRILQRCRIVACNHFREEVSRCRHRSHWCLSHWNPVLPF